MMESLFLGFLIIVMLVRTVQLFKQGSHRQFILMELTAHLLVALMLVQHIISRSTEFNYILVVLIYCALATHRGIQKRKS